ncbi:unnamed protein product [Pedinophyceae sp. YPF-701]|nr:unnamed protein product [Pedinophyceae sp. YPF-701]
MALKEEALRDKFRGLKATQDSIERLSAHCMFFKNKHSDVVRIWDEEFGRSSPQAQVSLLYLANDVIQKAAAKNLKDYCSSFYEPLMRRTRGLLKSADPAVRAKVQRTVDVWVKRQLFGNSGTQALIKMLKDTSMHQAQPRAAPAAPTQRAPTHTPPAPPAAPPPAPGEAFQREMAAARDAPRPPGSPHKSLSIECATAVDVMRPIARALEDVCKHEQQAGAAKRKADGAYHAAQVNEAHEALREVEESLEAELRARERVTALLQGLGALMHQRARESRAELQKVQAGRGGLEQQQLDAYPEEYEFDDV